MKKGFTLIELLAVIVILAIIALIATPIVLNIINDAKESAVLRSAGFYLEGVEKSIATSTLNNTQIKDGTYEIMQDGNICIGTLINNTCTGNILNVEIDGEIPNNGRITIEDGKIGSIVLKINNKVVLKNEKNELVFMTTIANYIKNLYNPTTTTTVNNIEYSLDETNLLMNDRLGSKDVDKLDGNIRYYGANPNNYIDIGDRDSDGNIIFWRIIGLFKDIEVTDENDNVIKTEDLVKIMRADFLTSGDINGFTWHDKENQNNNWNISTLQGMLNNAYYNSDIIDYYNESTSIVTLNFTSTGLSRETHDKIEKVKWPLGAHDVIDYVDILYGYERLGTNSWPGKIALMYPSDYGYSSDLKVCQSTLYQYTHPQCNSTSWMYDSTKNQWLLITYSRHAFRVFEIGMDGRVGHDTAYHDYYSVRPVLYLKSDVGIVEEKETSYGLKYLVVE